MFHGNQNHNEGLLSREHSLNKHYAFVFMVLGIELRTWGTKDKWLMTELASEASRKRHSHPVSSLYEQS